MMSLEFQSPRIGVEGSWQASGVYLLKMLAGEKENADRLPRSLGADTFPPSIHPFMPFIQVLSINSGCIWGKGGQH